MANLKRKEIFEEELEGGENTGSNSDKDNSELFKDNLIEKDNPFA